MRYPFLYPCGVWKPLKITMFRPVASPRRSVIVHVTICQKLDQVLMGICFLRAPTIVYFNVVLIFCQVWEEAGSNGLLGTSIPAEDGGIGGDTLTAAILFEEV